MSAERALARRLPASQVMQAPVICPEGHLYDALVWNHRCPTCGSEEGVFLHRSRIEPRRPQ